MFSKFSTHRMTHCSDIVMSVTPWKCLFTSCHMSFHTCQYSQIALQIFPPAQFVQCCTVIRHDDLLCGGVMKHFCFLVSTCRIQTVACSMQLLVIHLLITQSYISQLCKYFFLTHVFSKRGMTSFMKLVL